jgi:hypothetical protein
MMVTKRAYRLNRRLLNPRSKGEEALIRVEFILVVIRRLKLRLTGAKIKRRSIRKKRINQNDQFQQI